MFIIFYLIIRKPKSKAYSKSRTITGFKKTHFMGSLFCIFSPQFSVLALFTAVRRPPTYNTNAKCHITARNRSCDNSVTTGTMLWSGRLKNRGLIPNLRKRCLSSPLRPFRSKATQPVIQQLQDLRSFAGDRAVEA
jgi:hypothetical protein